MPESAADQAVDWAITQAIDLSRVEAGSRAQALAILQDLEGEIVGILDKNKLSIGKQKKLMEIQAAVSEATQAAYSKVSTGHQETLTGVAKSQGKGITKSMNAIIGASVLDPVLSDKQWEALASKTLIFGASSGEWWAGQSEGLRDKFSKQMRMGYGLGESVEELTRRVRGTKANGFNDGIMQTSRREAEALVRSSVQTISNAARIEGIKGMQPIAKGIEWVSTLDGRTTLTCMALHGKQWRFPDMEPVGHGKAFPGPTAHWNCRSTQIAATASWAELSGKKIPTMDNQTLQAAVEAKLKAKGMDPLKIAQVKVNAQSSMDGQVSTLKDWEQWLKGKSPEFVLEKLGPSRAALWQSGKLKLSDLTDQDNRPLTVKALEDAIEKGKIPDETEGQPFLPVTGIPKFKDTLQEANQTAQLEIDSTLANPKGKTLKAAALKKLQADEPNLTPVQMLAKAEGIAAEKQAAASKASKLSTARKKIKLGGTPSPAEQLVIDSLEGDELDNWKASLQDAKKVASQDALDKLKAASQPDGSLPDNPEVNGYLKQVTEADLATFDEFAKAKKQATSEQTKNAMKGALDSYTDVAELKVVNSWKLLTSEHQEDVLAAFTVHQETKIYDGKIGEWIKEGGDKQDAINQAKEMAAGLNVSSATIFNEAELIYETGIQSKAFAELEKIQDGEAEVQKGLKQKALAKLLKDEGADLDSLGPSDYPELLEKVVQEAAAKQAAAEKASKLSTAKKKLLAGKPPSPGEQAVIDALTQEELDSFNDAVASGKKAVKGDKAETENSLQGPVETYQQVKLTSHAAKIEAAEAFLAQQGIEDPSAAGKKPPTWSYIHSDAFKDFASEQEQMIAKALVGGDQVIQLKDSTGKTVGAVSFGSFEKKTNLDDLGSIAPQGGTQLFKTVVDSAAKSGDAIMLQSLPGATGFYEKFGLEHVSKQKGASAGDETAQFFAFPYKVKEAKKKIDDYLAGKTIPAPVTLIQPMGMSEAKTKMAEILASNDPELIALIEEEFGVDVDPDEPPTLGEAEATFDHLVAADYDGEESNFAEAAQKVITLAAAHQKKQLKEAKAQLKAGAVPDITPTGPATKELPPIDVAGLKKIKDLPGSTKPFLAEDPISGAQYVVKSTQKGLTQAHLTSETTADAIYRAAGMNVPASAMADKTTKVSEFLEGQTLADWKQGKSQKDINAMYREIRKGFVADALLANHDVAGASFDNIFVTKGGVPVRIDNGGALSFRAQGGKKEGWDDPSGKILELESLRDPGKAPIVSQITKGITKAEIEEQVASLFARREAIEKAAKALPKKDQDTLKRRFDWLEQEFSHVKPKETDTATRELLQNLFIPADAPQRIQKARMNGVALDVGSRHVEDTQALTWTEKDLNGNPVTVIQLKVTDAGAQAIEAKMAPEFAKATTVAPTNLSSGQHPEDTFAEPLIAAAKTLAHHAADKQFNESTIQNLSNQGAKLDQLAKSSDPAKKALAKHYQPLWDQLMDTVTEAKTASATEAKIKKGVPTVQQWHYDPKKFSKQPEAKKPSSDRTYERITQFQARANSFQDGHGQNIPGTAMSFSMSQGGYRVRTNDGVVIEYSSRAGSTSERAGLALEGTTVVRVPGDISPARLERALQELADFGIDVTPPSDDYKEYLLIRKTAALTSKTTLKGWQDIDTIQDAAQRAKAAREFAKKTWKVDLPKQGTEKWRKLIDGEPNHDGTGWKTWERIDLGENPGEKLKGFVLVHSTGTDLAMAVEGMLASGGEATSTMGRVQKGVPVNAGMSSQTDVTTGGAAYFFTRIRPKGSSVIGLQFKGELLKRADAISYTSDKYGRISAINTRKSSLSDYASMSGSDETIFKNSIDLVRDIDTIKTSNQDQRKQIIKAFKQHGYATLPDGRKIEDVVK